MKKLFVIFLLCLPPVAAAAEEGCVPKSPICFGVNWETATIDDIEKIDVNARSKSGVTSSSFSAELNRHPSLVSILIKKTADRMIDTTPLHWAAWKNSNPEILSILITSGADVNAQNKNGFYASSLGGSREQQS